MCDLGFCGMLLGQCFLGRTDYRWWRPFTSKGDTTSANVRQEQSVMLPQRQRKMVRVYRDMQEFCLWRAPNIVKAVRCSYRVHELKVTQVQPGVVLSAFTLRSRFWGRRGKFLTASSVPPTFLSKDIDSLPFGCGSPCPPPRPQTSSWVSRLTATPDSSCHWQCPRRSYSLFTSVLLSPASQPERAKLALPWFCTCLLLPSVFLSLQTFLLVTTFPVVKELPAHRGLLLSLRHFLSRLRRPPPSLGPRGAFPLVGLGAASSPTPLSPSPLSSAVTTLGLHTADETIMSPSPGRLMPHDAGGHPL